MNQIAIFYESLLDIYKNFLCQLLTLQDTTSPVHAVIITQINELRMREDSQPYLGPLYEGAGF
jgi:hypothetical protein